MYTIILSSMIQMLRSKVGNLPPKSSTDSIVKFNQSQIEFIISFMISIVFCSPVMPASLSSFLQSEQNCSLPSCHLHPNLMLYSHSLMSSMYLAFSSTVRLLEEIKDISSSSHQSIMILARAQVERNPMGPPFFWR